MRIWGRLMGAVKQLASESYYLVQYDSHQRAFFWKKYNQMKAERYYNGEQNPYECFQDYIDTNRSFLISKYWEDYFKNLKEVFKNLREVMNH